MKFFILFFLLLLSVYSWILFRIWGVLIFEHSIWNIHFFRFTNLILNLNLGDLLTYLVLINYLLLMLLVCWGFLLLTFLDLRTCFFITFYDLIIKACRFLISFLSIRALFHRTLIRYGLIRLEHVGSCL